MSDKVMIRCNKGYLDGIDWDNSYEWTQDKKTAWRLHQVDAERKLIQIRKANPEAYIVQK